MDIVSYILSRQFTKQSLIGMGALKGSPCQVKDIVHQDGINTVTFEWESTDGTKKTRDMVVYDGTPIYVWESGNTYHYGDLAIYESQFYRCIVENNDVTFDSTKWNEIGSPDGNYDIVQSVSLLPARFTAADRKLYYVIDENCFYLWNGTAWVKTISNKIADLDDVNLDDLAEGDVLVWDSVNEKWVNKAKFDEYKTAFTGTEEEWNALTSEEQNVYDIINITNDGDVLNLGIYLEKTTAMPVASEDVEHKIYLYTGTTTQNYKKGVVYQCVSDGQDPATYSWVALIDFGTASIKNSTDRVLPNSTDLVESRAVYSAINTALSSIYTPRGDITCAELTSALLISDNIGNVYETSDSGTTTALFLQGAGHPIAIGDNVGIINAGQGRILFNLMANAFDLTDYQKKDLANTIEGENTVEGALGALSTDKQSKDLTTAVESATTVEGALSALSDNKQAKTLSTSVESQTTVEGALGALSTNKATQAEVNDIVNVLGAKNFVPYPYPVSSATVNGITFTTYSDGRVVANGTATELAIFDVINSELYKSFALDEGNYILTDGLSSSDYENAYTAITLAFSDGTIEYNRADTSIGKNGFSMPSKSNIKYFYLGCCVKSGATVSNLTFRPMIRLASDPDSTYVPYAMTNQQMTPYVQAISNPNLLDNPWFTVNQRGLDNYSYSSGSSKYCFDRWKLGTSGMSISKSNDIFTVSAMNQYSSLVQKFPIDYLKEGDTYTLSVLFDDDTIESKTFVAQAGSAPFLGSWTHGNKKFNSLVTKQYSNQWQVIPFDYLGSNVETPATISFKAIKLEKGSVSTLAMDTAPNYASELQKCRRYYNVYTGCMLFGSVVDSNTVRISIPNPVQMRTTPTIDFTQSSARLITNGSSILLSGNTTTVLWNSSIDTTISIAGFSNLTANQIAILVPNTDSIKLSADL